VRGLLRQALRREHVLDFARADAEGERAERAVRARVAVAADDRHARLRQTELRADDVDDALLGRVDVVELDAELAAVAPERLDCSPRRGLRWANCDRGRDVVVDGRESQIGRRTRRPACAQPVETPAAT
jgi:hypothetical protein